MNQFITCRFILLSSIYLISKVWSIPVDNIIKPPKEEIFPAGYIEKLLLVIFLVLVGGVFAGT